MTVQPFLIGKVPNWHSEQYTLVPAVVEDGPIHPLLLALISSSPLFWAALAWLILR